MGGGFWDQTDRDWVELGHPGNHDPSNWSDLDWLLRIRVADAHDKED
jgi:hypothetical protein